MTLSLFFFISLFPAPPTPLSYRPPAPAPPSRPPRLAQSARVHTRGASSSEKVARSRPWRTASDHCHELDGKNAGANAVAKLVRTRTRRARTVSQSQRTERRARTDDDSIMKR